VYTKRTPMRDITHLVEDRTLVLVSATAKIPLWGLSLKARGPLFELLPRHLDVLPSHPNRPSDPAMVVRRHVRWTILAGVGFVTTAGAVIPFMDGYPLHRYWNSVGKHLLLLCLGFFIIFVFEVGFTCLLWSRKRVLDESERDQIHTRGSKR
jgi:hypothetical protein